MRLVLKRPQNVCNASTNNSFRMSIKYNSEFIKRWSTEYCFTYVVLTKHKYHMIRVLKQSAEKLCHKTIHSLKQFKVSNCERHKTVQVHSYSHLSCVWRRCLGCHSSWWFWLPWWPWQETSGFLSGWELTTTIWRTSQPEINANYRRLVR